MYTSIIRRCSLVLRKPDTGRYLVLTSVVLQSLVTGDRTQQVKPHKDLWSGVSLYPGDLLQPGIFSRGCAWQVLAGPP
jgi:hypothetical protein